MRRRGAVGRVSRKGVVGSGGDGIVEMREEQDGMQRK